MSSVSLESTTVQQLTDAASAAKRVAPKNGIYKQVGKALQSLGYSADQIASIQSKIRDAIAGAGTAVVGGADRATTFRAAVDGALIQSGVDLDKYRKALDPDFVPVNGSGTSDRTDTAEVSQGVPAPSRRPNAFAKNVDRALTSLGLTRDQIDSIQKQIGAALDEAGRAVAGGANRVSAFRNAVDGVLKKNGIEPAKFRAAIAGETTTTPTTDTKKTDSSKSGETDDAQKADRPNRRLNSFQKRLGRALGELGKSSEEIAQIQKEIQDALSEAGKQLQTDSKGGRGNVFRAAVQDVLSKHGISADQFSEAFEKAGRAHRNGRSHHGFAFGGAPSKPPVLTQSGGTTPDSTSPTPSTGNTGTDQSGTGASSPATPAQPTPVASTPVRVAAQPSDNAF